MDQISSISELLTLSNSSYRIFDMGRSVCKIAKTDFEKVEQAMQPYPYPLQGHAHIAIVFWQEQQTAPYIWFVKMPLDERGLLNQGSRNHYIAIILEALGSDLGQDPSEKQEELLKENPYNFTPSQYKLASLNSIVKRDLKQKTSEYYEHCQLYLSGKIGFDNWQGVGVQGLCDFAARTNSEENENHLISALDNIPDDVFHPLCSALENQRLSITILSKFISIAEQMINNDVYGDKLASSLRAISSNAENPLVQQLIKILLNSANFNDLNTLVTISGRCWLAVTDVDMLMLFLEKVVASSEQEVFVAIFQDLIAVPAIRPSLLQCIRIPDRSPKLSNAIGKLFSTVKGS
jgi:hypothetical protein